MNEIDNYIIVPSATLKDALIKMTTSRKGVLFVVNHAGHLEGVLSDGDVRRMLIQQVTLGTPVSKIMNLNPTSAQTFESAKTLLRSRHSLLAIPVVDREGKMAQLVILQEDKSITQVDVAREDRHQEDAPRKRVVALIPARGGSKRIPKKNLAKIGNKSLVGLAIEVVQESDLIDDIIVSTDDTEIGYEAQKYGVAVPWLRSAALSSDTAKSIDVVLDGFQKFEEINGYLPDIGLLIEPTAPLRTADHLNKAIKTLQSSDVDSVISINRIPHNYHPEELLVVENGLVSPYLANRNMDTRKLRGEQDPLYIVNGLVYAFKIKSLLSQQSLYGNNTTYIETDAEYFMDIDTIEDLKMAQLKYKSNV